MSELAPRGKGDRGKGGMVSRALGVQTAEGRVESKLGSPCTDGETEARIFLRPHGGLAT